MHHRHSLAAQLDLLAYRLRPETPGLYTDRVGSTNAALSTPLTGRTDDVRAVGFSPDGRTLATGSVDRTVQLWRLNLYQAIERICATTRNNLTPEKWKQYVSPDLPYDPPCRWT